MKIQEGSHGTFSHCIMEGGTILCLDKGVRATFESCTFQHSSSSHAWVRASQSPIQMIGQGCVVNMVGENVLKMPSSLDMYPKTSQESILVKSHPGSLLYMDGTMRIDFYHRENVSDHKIASETLMSNAIFKSLKMVDDGILSLPMVLCKGKNFKFECAYSIPETATKSFMGGSHKFLFSALPKYYWALARGFQVSMEFSSSSNTLDLRSYGNKEIMLMSTSILSQNLHVLGESARITVIPPVMLALSTPCHVKLEGLQINNVSPNAMKNYFESMPANAYEIPGWSGVENLVYSSVVLASPSSVVESIKCTFKMDIGCCSEGVGMCVVEQASVAMFRGCTFEKVVSGNAQNGGICVVCAAPAWGRVGFRGGCSGDQEVSGGCVVVG